MLKKCLPLLFCAALASGCAAQAGAGKAPNIAGRTFAWAGGVSEGCSLPPHITFGKDGSVSGMVGCNRILGSYKLHGDQLDLSQLGSTMMMCAPATMKSERAFMDYLARAKRVTAGSSGSVVLWDAKGEKIVTLTPVDPSKCAQ